MEEENRAILLSSFAPLPSLRLGVSYFPNHD